MADENVVIQSPKTMAVGEAIAWTMDFSDVGTPTSITSVLAYDATGVDKSGTVLSGAASIVGDTVIGKLFTPASAQTYRLVYTVVIASQTIVGLLDVIVSPSIPGQVAVTNGYATLIEMKQYIAPRTPGDYWDDTVIADLIQAASRYIDNLTGRRFYASTETRYYSVPEGRELFLDDDLITVTTLTNGDGTVLTTSDYYLMPKNTSPKYSIVLKESSAYYWEYDSSSNSEYVITVIGTWGYAATAPVEVEQLCKEMVARMYKRRFGENYGAETVITSGGVVISPNDIPRDLAKTVVDRYKRTVL